MQVLYPRCCAVDVHKRTAVACLRIAEDSKVTTEVRTFDTTTASLIGPRDWLAAIGVGERRACQECAGPQDRRQRRRMDLRPAGARSHSRELRTRSPDAGAART